MSLAIATIKFICTATGAIVWAVPITFAAATTVGYMCALPRVRKGETVTYKWGPTEWTYRPTNDLRKDSTFTYKNANKEVHEGEIVEKKN